MYCPLGSLKIQFIIFASHISVDLPPYYHHENQFCSNVTYLIAMEQVVVLHPCEAYGELRIAFLSFQVTESSFDPRHRFEREAERP